MCPEFVLDLQLFSDSFHFFDLHVFKNNILKLKIFKKL